MSKKLKKSELLKMIQDLQERVRVLEARPYYPPFTNPQNPFPPDTIFIPSIWTQDLCSDGGSHDYPNPWHATVPPPCKKCGKQGPSFTQITCSNVTGTETHVVDGTKLNHGITTKNAFLSNLRDKQ